MGGGGHCPCVLARVMGAGSTGLLAPQRTTSFGPLLAGPISFPEWLAVPKGTQSPEDMSHLPTCCSVMTDTHC